MVFKVHKFGLHIYCYTNFLRIKLLRNTCHANLFYGGKKYVAIELVKFEMLVSLLIFYVLKCIMFKWYVAEISAKDVSISLVVH